MLFCEMEHAPERPENPWPKWLSFVTMGLAVLLWIAGLYAIMRENPRRIPAFLGMLVAELTVARRELCARCPYYGEYCTMLIGKWTSLVYERREGPPPTFAYLLDGFLGGALFLAPLPSVTLRSRRLLALYLAAGVAFMCVSMKFSCGRCRMDSCPANRVLRTFGLSP